MGLDGLRTRRMLPLLHNHGQSQKRQLAKDSVLRLHGLDDPRLDRIYHLCRSDICKQLVNRLLHGQLRRVQWLLWLGSWLHRLDQKGHDSRHYHYCLDLHPLHHCLPLSPLFRLERAIDFGQRKKSCRCPTRSKCPSLAVALKYRFLLVACTAIKCVVSTGARCWQHGCYWTASKPCLRINEQLRAFQNRRTGTHSHVSTRQSFDKVHPD